jgi:hypothetical protein
MKYTASADAPKSYHVPAGDYTVTIVEATETVSRATGADMIKLTLLAETPDGASAKVFDYLVASASSAWKIDAFRRALGHEIDPEELVELTAEELIGLTLRVRLKVENYNGKANNKVEFWLAPLLPTVPAASANAVKKEGAANEPF